MSDGDRQRNDRGRRRRRAGRQPDGRVEHERTCGNVEALGPQSRRQRRSRRRDVAADVAGREALRVGERALRQRKIRIGRLQLRHRPRLDLQRRRARVQRGERDLGVLGRGDAERHRRHGARNRRQVVDEDDLLARQEVARRHRRDGRQAGERRRRDRRHRSARDRHELGRRKALGHREADPSARRDSARGDRVGDRRRENARAGRRRRGRDRGGTAPGRTERAAARVGDRDVDARDRAGGEREDRLGALPARGVDAQRLARIERVVAVGVDEGAGIVRNIRGQRQIVGA